ncbi:MAG TPA: 16S rRNA (cytidine(1402)-2'-O)-methyltransferase [Myxococcota bacterium]|nr:16S rRNA (cytidine(1402)-2'-O)-methyltransferase [Myxococcota bacterium]
MGVLAGTLWVVATPIGNLEDMTHRATRVLASVGRVLCEDTRRTRTLLDHFGIADKVLVRFDAHAERDRIDEVLSWLEHGEDLALVSDAGTPGINDPGERLVRAAAAKGHRVIPVPGCSSVIAAVSASGLGGGGFSFGGFLPKGSEALRTKLAGLSQGVWVFFAPARDLRDVVESMAMVSTVGQVVVGRELTKLHETFYRGDAQALVSRLEGDDEALLGEAVLVFEVIEAPLTDEVIEGLLREQLAGGKSSKAAVEAVAGALGLPRRRVYQLALKLG